MGVDGRGWNVGIGDWRDFLWWSCGGRGGGLWIGGGGSGGGGWGVFIGCIGGFFANLSLFCVICSIVPYSN